MKIDIIYQDSDILVVEKPAGIIVFSETGVEKETLIGLLLKQIPDLKKTGSAPRYGIVHRLDKGTSGILLVAKNNKSLSFFQNQFKNREVTKRYTALVNGKVREKKGRIETLIGRAEKNRIKQKIYFPFEPKIKGKREAVTEYKVLTYFFDDFSDKKNYYTLVEVGIKTGRKHQIRAHFEHLGHPVAGDDLYFFKDQSVPADLKRQFLHASFLKIKLLDGKEREFKSQLPEDLKKILQKLKEESI